MTKTAQEVFNGSVIPLLAQGCKSTKDCVCLYRGPDDTKCAVGFLIPDKLYEPGMDQGDYSTLQVAKKIGLNDHYDLLKRLQSVHDGSEPGQWRERFHQIAKAFGLEMVP